MPAVARQRSGLPGSCRSNVGLCCLFLCVSAENPASAFGPGLFLRNLSLRLAGEADVGPFPAATGTSGHDGPGHTHKLVPWCAFLVCDRETGAPLERGGAASGAPARSANALEIPPGFADRSCQPLIIWDSRPLSVIGIKIPREGTKRLFFAVSPHHRRFAKTTMTASSSSFSPRATCTETSKPAL